MKDPSVLCLWKHNQAPDATGVSYPYLVLHDPGLDPLVLVAGLQRHEVHAALPAVVARAQPVLFHAAQRRVPPREEVAFVYGNMNKLSKLMLISVFFSGTVYLLP